MLFQEMDLWVDTQARCGEESMAVDEWLVETRSKPTLRVYRFDGDWVSIGYFGKIEQVKQSLGDVRVVRRWTGGGTVDHRGDWTYSLIVPNDHGVSKMKGSELYRYIHAELMLALGQEGNVTQLSSGQKKCGCMCFENPVEFDVLDEKGQKIAGAAQKKSKYGLLHQGSVSIPTLNSQRGKTLAEALSASYEEVKIFTDDIRIDRLVREKYGNTDWLLLR